MPKYVIEHVTEKVTRYVVDAVDEEDAEAQVESNTASVFEQYDGDASFRVVDVTPDPEPEQYWTAMGTFSITRHGTEKDARREIESALDEIMDEYEIQSLD